VNYEALKDELVRDEGLRLKPYRDTVGKTTIGVGRNLDDRGLSTDEVHYLLDNDIREVEEELSARLSFWRNLSEVRQRVLMNMAFNLGIDGLLTFRNTLKAVEEGRYSDAAKGMMQSKWAKQTGARAVRLAQMMLVG
jgi:lysozyme